MCRCIRLIEYRISYVKMYVLRFDLRTYCVGFEKYNAIFQVYRLAVWFTSNWAECIYVCMWRSITFGCRSADEIRYWMVGSWNGCDHRVLTKQSISHPIPRQCHPTSSNTPVRRSSGNAYYIPVSLFTEAGVNPDYFWWLRPLVTIGAVKKHLAQYLSWERPSYSSKLSGIITTVICRVDVSTWSQF